MFVGSLISGGTIDYFTRTVGAAVERNWQAFWLTSATCSFVVLLLIALFFRSRARIKAKDRL